MKKAIALLLLVASGAVLSGCNTVNGMGKDVERAGEKVQSVSGK
ncbi:MAG: entericidin A/B family lipoprotein [Herminiimonas sp.]|nr:entericidin A/B family lipoprotein [Herminiimonas sp.]